MNFSMNGFRQNLHDDLKELKEQVMLVLNDGHFEKDDLTTALDAVICSSNTLNCVYNNEDESFSDMSDLYLPIVDEDETA